MPESRFHAGFSGHDAYSSSTPCMVHRSDPELVQACIRGEPAAWAELVDRYTRLVYSIPRRYGLSEADSDDVHAAVWGTVFNHLDRLKDQTRLSAWLITTTHRECWRVGRRRDVYADLEDVIVDVGSPSEDQAEQWERQHLLRQGLVQLGGRCQELLEALYLGAGEPSYETIAAQLSMKVGSIGPTRARCLEKLEKILVELGLDEDIDVKIH
jgi:RNA polymerase sigma factor (sigma-70 family)